MEIAVVSLLGKQYLVTKGDSIQVESNLSLNKNIEKAKVLLYANDTTLNVGTPVVDGVTVDFDIPKMVKTKRIRVSTFRAKSRTRKTTGFSSKQAKIEVVGLKHGKN